MYVLAVLLARVVLRESQPANQTAEAPSDRSVSYSKAA
jgi:hypothetical protein